MFIKLTNEVDNYKGTPLILAISAIMSVFVQTDVEKNEKYTLICHTDNKTIWRVRETVDQVYDLIVKAQRNIA